MHTDLNQTGRQSAAADALRRLPDEAAPPYNWQEFQSRSRRRRHTRLDPRYAAAAALVVLVVGAVAAWFSEKSSSRPAVALREVSAETGRGVPVASSQELERWLASLPREPAVVHVGTRAAVAGLEDQLAEVDDMLTAARLDGVRSDRLEALQRERTRLVGSLAQVRYAEVLASASP